MAGLDSYRIAHVEVFDMVGVTQFGSWPLLSTTVVCESKGMGFSTILCQAGTAQMQASLFLT